MRDILNDAAENPGKYDWKMLTVTDWAGYWLCLRKFNSAQIGKALEQCGVEAEFSKVGKNSTKMRRVPVYRQKKNYWEE